MSNEMRVETKISMKLREAAVMDTRVLQFAKSVPRHQSKIKEVTNTADKITVSEFSKGIKCNPDDFLRFDLSNPTQKVLVENLNETLDHLAISAFKSTHLKAIPVSCFPHLLNPKILPNRTHPEMILDTDGVPSTIATVNVDSSLCKVMIDYLETTSTPYYERDWYFGLGSPKLISEISGQPGSKTWGEYLKEGDVLFEGERCKVDKIRWIEIINVRHLSNSIGFGGMVGEGIVFGDEGIQIVEADPPYLKVIDGNVMWFGVVGCGLESNARVIHITSAKG